MIRVLLCMTCCSVPNTRSAQVRGKSANNPITSDEKQAIKSDNSAPQSSDLKDNLLENQIQAHNNNYGSKSSEAAKPQKTESTGEEISTAVSKTKSVLDPVDGGDETSVSKLLKEDDSITASTSALLQKSRLAASNEEQGYTKYTELSFDDKSVSPPSSIDIGEFQETTSSTRFAPGRRRSGDADDGEEEEEEQEGNGIGGQQQVASGEFTTHPSSFCRVRTGRFNGSGLPLGSSRAASQREAGSGTSQPTTKIGHYARLEYSPVEDLESLTSKSASRPNSERYATSSGGAGLTGLSLTTSTNEEPLSGSQSHTEGISASVSRRSSRRSSRGGIESTSISISSQLSNEQLQQNLTNMLESATNSPTALFGTIGLPLGPPLERDVETTETRRTSPETTGAALTSASQDSLSGGSLADEGRKSVPTTANSPDGAALIASNSLERDMTNSVDLAKQYSDISRITTSTLKTLSSNAPFTGEPDSRVQSALSQTTTTSGQLTNPTPTPSELSGGAADGTGKKKGKLRPKSLLKRFKSGKKKNKEENLTQ